MVALMVAEEGLATTQVHHLVEAKVVPALWIVPPWSRESPTWRGRRPCWRRREGLAPPRRRPRAGTSAGRGSTDRCLASAIMVVVATQTAAPTTLLSVHPLHHLQCHHRVRGDLLWCGQAAGQLTTTWQDSQRSCWTEMLTMPPTRLEPNKFKITLLRVQIELDLGCTTRTGNPRDCSPRPLFKRWIILFFLQISAFQICLYFQRF